MEGKVEDRERGNGNEFRLVSAVDFQVVSFNRTVLRGLFIGSVTFDRFTFSAQRIFVSGIKNDLSTLIASGLAIELYCFLLATLFTPLFIHNRWLQRLK